MADMTLNFKRSVVSNIVYLSELMLRLHSFSHQRLRAG